MKKIIPWAVMACLFLIPDLPTVAATFELPLALATDQEPWGEQIIDFDTGMPLDELREIRLRVVGDGGGQPYLACMDFRFCCYQPGQIRFDLYGDPEVPYLDRIEDSFGSGSREPFDREWIFTLDDLSVLADGAGRLVIDDPAGMFYSDSLPGFVCPLGNGCVITAATLVFEYGDTVPVQETTWGALKAIYR